MKKDTEVRDLIDFYLSIPAPSASSGKKQFFWPSEIKSKLLADKKECEKTYERLKSLWMQTRSKDHLNSVALFMEKLNDIDRQLLANRWL